MRREVLIGAVRTVKNDLEDSGLRSWLSSVIAKRHSKSEKVSVFMDAEGFSVFKKYSILTSKYGEAESSVLEIMDLGELSDPGFWVALVDPDSNDIYGVSSKVRFIIEQFPRVLELLSQDYVDVLKGGGSVPNELQGRSVVSVILVEDHGQFSTPARLIYALEAITKIYSVVAHIEGVGDSDLAILAIDSGSDKSFDFLGLAKVMEEVKIILLNIWDRRVFHKHLHVSQCLDLIAKSLPIVEKINDLKQSGALGAEQAEILKRKALEGASQFLEAGALIAEMGNVDARSARQLMRPEPKLLAGPSSSEVRNAESGNPASESNKLNHPEESPNSEMSMEEVAELERLVNKAKGVSSRAGVKRPKRNSGI